MEALQFFETSGITRPTTQRLITLDLNHYKQLLGFSSNLREQFPHRILQILPVCFDWHLLVFQPFVFHRTYKTCFSSYNEDLAFQKTRTLQIIWKIN
jgi:hypothetical protein